MVQLKVTSDVLIVDPSKILESSIPRKNEGCNWVIVQLFVMSDR